MTSFLPCYMSSVVCSISIVGSFSMISNIFFVSMIPLVICLLSSLYVQYGSTQDCDNGFNQLPAMEDRYDLENVEEKYVALIKAKAEDIDYLESICASANQTFCKDQPKYALQCRKKGQVGFKSVPLSCSTLEKVLSYKPPR